MITEAYPLQWPTGWKRTKRPKPSSFGSDGNKPSIHRATQELRREMKLLKGKHLVISSDLRLRKDGLPISSQRQPDDPGVALYFTLDGEQKVIACDSYNRAGCNIWAIAKTVNALRGIDRWGASELLTRAFTGFKALPAQGVATTAKTWYDTLKVSPDCSVRELKAAYRELAKRYHPDRIGENDYFYVVQDAYEKGLLARQ